MRRIAFVHDPHDPMAGITVSALDEPGPGGDCHQYRIDHDGMDFHVPVDIAFQDGDPTQCVNGITMESLLAVIRDRLEGCQTGPFACIENEHALRCIKEADDWLKYRKRQRS